MKSTRQGRAKPARNASRIRRNRSPRDGVSGRNPRSATTKREPARRRSRYQTLFENLRQGAFYQRADGVLLNVNPAALELFGLTRKEFLRRTSEDPEWKVIREDGSPFPGAEHPSVLALRTGRAVRNAVAGVFNPRRNTYVWLEINAIPEFRRGGKKPYQVLVTLHDITERKAAENALRETNARLAAVFEGTQDAIFVADTATGRIVDANPGAARLLRRSRESILGMHQSELHPPQESERYRQQFNRQAGQTMPSHAEAEAWTSDGRRVPVEISASTITLTGGQRVLVGVFRDITERKLADKRRQQDAQRTELLLDLHQRAPRMTDRELYDYVLEKAVALTDSAIGFFHQVSEDQKTIILTTWNQEALKNCTATFDSHYPLGEAGNWVDCVRQQRPIVYNDFAHSPNQKGLPAGHAPLHRFMSIPVVEAGRVRIIFGVGNKAEDYTEGDVAQLQLVANELHKVMAQRHAQQRLRLQVLLLDQIADTVTATDLEGRITYVNAAQARAMGRSRAELIGQSVVEYGDDPVRGASQHDIIAATREQGCWQGEVVNRDTAGREFIVEARTALVRDEGGQPVGMIGVGTDITARKRADDALRRSEERYRRMVETAREGVWAMDREHRTTFVNDQLAAMLGYDAAEMLGRTVEEFMFPEDLLAHQERMARRHAGQGASYEHRFRRRDGGTLWAIVSATALSDAQGQFDGSFAMFTDITQRKQAEQALAASNARLEAVFRVAPTGVGVVVDRVLQEVNDRVLEMTGYLREELVGGSSRLLYPTEEDFLFVGREKYRQIAERGTGTVESRWRRKDGVIRNVLLSSTPLDPADHSRGVVFTALDITERKRAEEAVRKLSRAVEQSPASVMITDLEGNTEYVNGRFTELTGYSSAEILGQNPRILQSGQTPADTYRQLWQAITSGREWDGEMLNRKKNGDLFWERALISPIKDAGGRITHYLGIKEDITERKRAEAELRASREQLRALAASLTRAEQRERRRIATLLHDDVIQSLALTRIKLGALRAQLPSAELQTLLDSIRTHLEGAINSTRSMTFQLSPPILHELGLEAALAWLAEQFSSEHGVHCEFAADAPPAALDEETRNLLFTATRELLLNVVKHARATHAHVTTQTDGGLLRVVVEDDGVGWQSDSTARPDAKTGGFGLFSIRERLSYLGGHCDVQSAPARGTRVTLTLPLSRT